MTTVAVYPGSFDPITNGHISILKLNSVSRTSAGASSRFPSERPDWSSPRGMFVASPNAGYTYCAIGVQANCGQALRNDRTNMWFRHGWNTDARLARR